MEGPVFLFLDFKCGIVNRQVLDMPLSLLAEQSSFLYFPEAQFDRNEMLRVWKCRLKFKTGVLAKCKEAE